MPFSSLVVTWLRAGFVLTFVLTDHLCVESNAINLRVELPTVRTLIWKRKLAKDGSSCQLQSAFNMAIWPRVGYDCVVCLALFCEITVESVGPLVDSATQQPPGILLILNHSTPGL